LAEHYGIRINIQSRFFYALADPVDAYFLCVQQKKVSGLMGKV
jgi:hypothetical protein